LQTRKKILTQLVFFLKIKPDLFEENVRKYPNREALVFENQSYTYKQLDEASNQISHFAVSKGLKNQDFVALMMKNR
jgi:non-ribosomal peptide synthetase component F